MYVCATVDHTRTTVDHTRATEVAVLVVVVVAVGFGSGYIPYVHAATYLKD